MAVGAPAALASAGGASAPTSASGSTTYSGSAASAGGGSSAPGDRGAGYTPTSTTDAPPAGPTQGAATPDPTTAGGTAFVLPVRKSPGRLTVPGYRARIIHGFAYAPENAPFQVQQAIWAANRIVGLPYVWGGGHQAFKSSGYDCSGTVSYALHGGKLLTTPMDSTEFESFGEAGPGTWMTIYANGGHAYMVIAGIRLDTSAAGDPSGGKGPRWRTVLRSNSGFTARHPVGY